MPILQPKDIIAILVLLFILTLKILGLNGTLDPALCIILGYYFVKRQDHEDNGK